jgi:hypothetical protein
MPLGLIFMKWNQIMGSEILAKYPAKVEIPDKNLIQIFDTHDLNGQRGLISLMVGTIKVISYYSGPETNYCIILLLDIDDDPDDYENILAEISLKILQNLEVKDYLDMFPSLYQQITLYPSLNFEQRLAMTYHNDIKRKILNFLRNEGVIFKTDLTNWLQESYQQSYSDIETVLFDLVQQGIIEILSVKSERSLLLFLIKDIIMFRIPPFKLLKSPSESGLPDELHKSYQIDCEMFFENYEISETDNLKIIEHLINPHVYETLSLLRGSAATKKELEKLKGKVIDDIKFVIDLLNELKIIKTYTDSKGNEYYSLLSDFFIDFCLPEYILKIIKTDHENNLKSNKVLLKYLDLLEHMCYKLKRNKKNG